MAAGRILEAGSGWAGALLMTLMVLRPPLAHCMETPEHFLYQGKAECLYTNGTERVRFLVRYIYNEQQIVHFDSDVGLFVADTELGRPDAEYWNKDPAILADERTAVDRFCRHNYGVAQTGKMVGRTGERGRGEVDRFCRHNYGAIEPFSVDRRVEPEVTVSPTQSGSGPHPHLLVCSVTGFYPGGVEISWLKNGQEQTAGVVSTELLQNGDWTFQILVMLEISPRRGDVYTCQVEHVSLRGPLAVHWEAQSDSARSKMLTGVGGFVLGLIFLVPGLLVYLRNKKGRPVPQPAGLLS